ncbi:MAG: energy-dependent translational throttle protein EttA [Candidatus Cloacimonadota bacterium]|nr:MAG: energy-dependent translational throttle protein EttA [Candidatus Cloacimonadota bacterium]
MEEKKVIYSMDRVGKIYQGNKQVLKDISLGYYYGAKIGVIGLNGSGKSSLLKIMAGSDEDYVGQISSAKGYSIGYLEQDPKLDPEKTVLETVKESVRETVELLEEFEKINLKFAEPMSDEEMNKLLDRQAKVQDKLDAMNAWDLDSRLEMAMNSLRCPPPEQKIAVISGGERRRTALCRLLLMEPDILLLDEPTNHLDAETILWLEHHLQNYKGTVIAVTHDRYFLDNVASWILELDRGEGIPWKGNYTSWLEQKQNKLKNEEKRESRRQKDLKHELEWIKSTPKAKHNKNKARITNYEKMLEEEYRKRNETNEIYVPAGPKLGKNVISAKELSKSYDDKILCEDLNFTLPPGGIIGIIGANGAGKTTLFKMIIGMEKPDSGSIETGKSVKLSYVDQNREMDNEKTLLELTGEEKIIIGDKEINSRQYLSGFNFSSHEHGKKIRELSGGEKNRAFLALTLKQGGNVLLLDEPTNDLDIHTIRALEEALQNFAGCAVVISHDRYFLDKICTHILAFEGDSKVKWFDGNFSEYEEDKIKRLGKDAVLPKRITYRKLTRV